MRRWNNINERPVPGGSMVPRLSPKIADNGLNMRLGPRLPTPLVRETSDGAVHIEKSRYLRGLAGLSPRLQKD